MITVGWVAARGSAEPEDLMSIARLNRSRNIVRAPPAVHSRCATPFFDRSPARLHPDAFFSGRTPLAELLSHSPVLQPDLQSQLFV